MPYLGNGQYQIINNKTGDKKIISRDELGQYGLQSHPSDVSPSTQEGGNFLSSAIGRLVTGGAPIAEAMKYSPTAQRIGEEAMRAVQRGMTGDLSTPVQEPGFVQTQALKAFGPLGSIAAGVTGVSPQEQKNLPAYGEIATEFAGSQVLPKVLEARKFLQPGKYAREIAGKTTGLAEQATQAGKTIKLNDFYNRFIEKVTPKGLAASSTGKPLIDPELRKGVNAVWAKVAPAALGEQEMTPAWLLQIRRNLLSRYGENILGSQVGKPVEKQAANVLRNFASEEFHRLVPEAKNLDKLYPILKDLEKVAPAAAIKVAKALGFGALSGLGLKFAYEHMK